MEVAMQVGSTIPDTPPPFDSVALWISRTIAQDYEARGVFSEVLQSPSYALRGALSLQVVSLGVAEAILNDAQARHREARSGMCTAFRGLIRAVRQAMLEARERSVVATGGVAYVRSSYGAGNMNWIGTAEGLQRRASVVLASGSWPEPGRSGRWWRAGVDGNGRNVHVHRYGAPWPNLFIAEVLGSRRESAQAFDVTTLRRLVAAPVVDLALVRRLRAEQKEADHAA